MTEEPMIQIKEQNEPSAPWVPVGEPFPAPVSNELDRAIDAGHAAVNAKDGFPSDWREQGKDYETDRTYARALVAELLRGIECKLRDEPLIPAAQAGANAALAEIRRRAGLEGEG